MRISLGDFWDDVGVDPSYTGTQISSDPVSSGGGFNWSSLIAPITQIGAQLTKVYATRNAVPQLNPGESITQLANGTYQVTQNANGIASGAALGLTSSATLGGLSLPVLLAIGVGAVVLLKGK